jgi:hypothetical protein
MAWEAFQMLAAALRVLVTAWGSFLGSLLGTVLGPPTRALWDGAAALVGLFAPLLQVSIIREKP